MIVYCDFNDYKGNIILDPVSLSEMEKWWLNLYDYGLINRGWDREDERSMINITGLKTEKYRGFSEGFFYNLPFNFWKYFEFETVESESSHVFRIFVYYILANKINVTDYIEDDKYES